MVLGLGPDVSWADKNAWAPAITERDGKCYFYFCAEQQIGVAVADSPAGPFKDALGRPLVAKGGSLSGQMIDPSVFTDDWYIVYHRFALNGPGTSGGDGMRRETAVDRMEFAADGTILPVVPTLESVRPVRR